MITEHVLFRLVPSFKVWFEFHFKELGEVWLTIPIEVKKHYGSIWNFAFDVWTEDK